MSIKMSFVRQRLLQVLLGSVEPLIHIHTNDITIILSISMVIVLLFKDVKTDLLQDLCIIIKEFLSFLISGSGGAKDFMEVHLHRHVLQMLYCEILHFLNDTVERMEDHHPRDR